MLFEGDAVPLRYRVAVVIRSGDALLPGEQGVTMFDVVEVAYDGDGRLGIAAGTEMPLQVADPEHQVGNDGSAGIDFHAEQLVRIDSEAGVFEGLLVLAEGGEGFKDFAFQALHVLERDIEKVAGAAGRIEDAGVAELAVEVAGGFDGIGCTACVDEFGDGGEGVGPVAAQGLDKRGYDEALDIGAGRVVGAEGVTFGGIQGPFEQGAEDGRFDVTPAGIGRFDKVAELVARERECSGRFEQAAIEAQDGGLEDGREAAGVHGLPEGGSHLREEGDLFVIAKVFEQVEPGAAGQQADVFCKGGKDAAGKEFGYVFGWMGEFESTGKTGEFGGYFAGDFGSVAGGVERVGVEPDGTEAVAQFRLMELRQEDAVGAGIGKWQVGLAGKGKVGEELDGVADVDGDEEGWPAFGSRQGLGVMLGLSASGEHGLVPAMGAANGAAGTGGARLRTGEAEFPTRVRGEDGCVAALLGFEDEVRAAVEIDAAYGGGAVEVVEVDALFKDVGVAMVV